MNKITRAFSTIAGAAPISAIGTIGIANAAGPTPVGLGTTSS